VLPLTDSVFLRKRLSLGLGMNSVLRSEGKEDLDLSKKAWH
jgi:hypothetical protein